MDEQTIAHLVGRLEGKVDELGRKLDGWKVDHDRRHADAEGRLDRTDDRLVSLETERARIRTTLGLLGGIVGFLGLDRIRLLFH